ncbi:MAG: group 1 truncated hemoglobin [Nitrospirae bacterium]|nr:group 1 truncated hemoglobin [Nitrospirota bacterium]
MSRRRSGQLGLGTMMCAEKQQTLYHDLGGKPTLARVHKIFYDKIYKHPWIGQYFHGISQTVIEDQQTDFMTAAMGGPEIYQGKPPNPAHRHMNITEELFGLRQALLKKSLEEANIPGELAAKWLKIDGAFRKGLVKESLAACEKRFTTDHVLDFQNPMAQ